MPKGYKIKLNDGTFYFPIPSLCECDDITCNEIVYNGHKFIHGHNSKGKNNPMFGIEPWCKGLTNETSELIKLKSNKTSKSLTGVLMSKERKIKHTEEKRLHPPMLGKHHTKESKEKQRQAKLGIKNHRYGKPSPIGAGRGRWSYYQSPLQGKIRLRSSYEFAYAQYLDQNNIPWYYEFKTFELSEGMTYTPDFFLLDQNKYVEIKGYMYLKHQLKIEKFIKEYNLNFEILNYIKLKEINIL